MRLELVVRREDLGADGEVACDGNSLAVAIPAVLGQQHQALELQAAHGAGAEEKRRRNRNTFKRCAC